MESKSVVEFLVNLLGLGILIWFFSNALIDMMKGSRHKSVFHNVLIIGITVIYSLKILLKDLLGMMWIQKIRNDQNENPFKAYRTSWYDMPCFTPQSVLQLINDEISCKKSSQQSREPPDLVIWEPPSELKLLLLAVTYWIFILLSFFLLVRYQSNNPNPSTMLIIMKMFT